MLTSAFSRDITMNPAWADNNPYLEALRPRFFSQIDGNADWADLPQRVGKLFKSSELHYSDHIKSQKLTNELVEMIHAGEFFPNSPVMMNSERDTPINLFACHVLAPPKHSDDLSIAKHIHDGCGGIGYDFSELVDPVSSTLMIESETERLNPNRKRKAHSAVTLSCNHPKVLDFIKASDQLTITHSNVELDELFFKQLESGNNRECEVWDALNKSIYFTGRPSVSFLAEKRNRSRSKLINNVCGESLLRENESALIGSINLTKFVNARSFSYERFKRVASMALRCLDNLHDVQDHASSIIRQKCMESRRVGVGVFGYADTLMLLGIRYGSPESFEFVDMLMSTLRSTLIEQSEKLGFERGFCDQSLLLDDTHPRRNASLMVVAANGTLSLLANVCGGIEPVFSFLIRQKINNDVFVQLQPTLKRLLNQHHIDPQLVIDELMAGKYIASLEFLPNELRKVLIDATSLSTEEHVLTQARFQRYIDGGISKTINLPSEASVKDIKAAILLAKQHGCVGLSLYRNGSLIDQPSQMVI